MWVMWVRGRIKITQGKAAGVSPVFVICISIDTAVALMLGKTSS